MENEENTYEREIALQKKYVDALIKAKPGLGEKALAIAGDMINTGLSPNEAMALINLIYVPADLQGRGQATKLKHFSEALIKRYGESYLERIGRSPALFRGFLYQVGQAIEMRDEINQSRQGSSITFRDTLLFQELGLSAEVLDGYIYHLTSEEYISEVAALMRIKAAAVEVEKKNFATLEGILFRNEYDTTTKQVMEDDRTDDE